MVYLSKNTKTILALVGASTAGIGAVYYTQFPEYYQNAQEDFFLPQHLQDLVGKGDNSSENKAYSTEIGSNLNLTGRSSGTGAVEESKAKELLKKIKSYTLKVRLPCDSGTAWILDYAKPTKGTYPTKWFLVTNAHVVSSFRFLSNLYGQTLPIPLRETQYYQNRYKHIYPSLSITDPGICGAAMKYGYSSMTIYKESEKENDIIYYTSISHPKLFYAPINFLGSRYSKRGYRWKYDNYYKDIAILEVDFETEETAKKLTQDYYDSHKLSDTQAKSEQKSLETLNLFGEEIFHTKTGEEINKSEENYFIAGYPVRSRGEYTNYSIQSNWNENSKRASRLTNWNYPDSDDGIKIRNKEEKEIKGHVNIWKIDKKYSSTTTVWNYKPHYNWGYNYLLDNVDLTGGASGSLVTDSKGDILGVYRMHDNKNRLGFVEPLRSNGLYVNSKIVLPKYDLIKGAPGQITSYKQQLEKYYPNTQTYLKSKNWQ